MNISLTNLDDMIRDAIKSAKTTLPERLSRLKFVGETPWVDQVEEIIVGEALDWMEAWMIAAKVSNCCCYVQMNPCKEEEGDQIKKPKGRKKKHKEENHRGAKRTKR